MTGAGKEDLEKINRLLTEIDKSEHTNLELHNLLLTANDSYREEHSRQHLHSIITGLRVNLQADVLLPWLAITSSLADELFPTALNLIAGHERVALTSLEQMWSRLLAPPVQASVPEADITMPVTELLQGPLLIFTVEDQTAVRDFLRAELYGPRRLRELLLVSDECGLSLPAKRLFVLLTMQQFGALGERLQFRVRPTGAQFLSGAFSGDDLELSRLEQ